MKRIIFFIMVAAAWVLGIYDEGNCTFAVMVSIVAVLIAVDKLREVKRNVQR